MKITDPLAFLVGFITWTAIIYGCGWMQRHIAASAQRPKLQVWFDCMPESNGNANWTAILHTGDLSAGHTIDRSEHYDRVRYEADRVRWLIGERSAEPFIIFYDPDMLSPPGWQHPCGVQRSDDGQA